MSNRAWVTLATNDSYGLGALVLAHSLRRAGSTYPAVVLITPSVTEPMRDRLRAVFAEVIIVDVLDSRDAAHLALLQRPELGITFTKIHCWNLTQYDKCVFLDADTLVVQNSDELFEREQLAAAPDVGWPDCFNSGVFVFTPSADTFAQLITFAQERGSFDGGDQGLLNSFFSDWARGDINKHLPFLYNVTSAAFYSYLPALKHFGQNLKIIHFIGAAKPWLQQFNFESGTVDAPEHIRGLLQLWWDIFVSQVHPQLDTGMVEVEEPPEVPAIPPHDVSQHYHYQPILDPQSEFAWHHPDAQKREEHQEQQLDLTEFYDPWNIYRGQIPPNTNNETASQSELGGFDNQEEIRKYVWEHQAQEHSHHDNQSHHSEHNWHNSPQQHEHHWHQHHDHTSTHNHYEHQHTHDHQSHTQHHYDNSSHSHQHESNCSADDQKNHGRTGHDSIHHTEVDMAKKRLRRQRRQNRSEIYVHEGGVLNGDISGSESDDYIEEITPRHPYDNYYLRHRATIDMHGKKICSHEVPPTPSPSPPPDSPSPVDNFTPLSADQQFSTYNLEVQSGVAGNLARVLPGAAGQREALDELTRRQGWEAGNIDYMGADSFDNIWAKISQTLSQARSSPPKQSPPREIAPPQPAPEQIDIQSGEVAKEPVSEQVEVAKEAAPVDAVPVEAPAPAAEAPATTQEAPAPTEEAPAPTQEALAPAEAAVVAPVEAAVLVEAAAPVETVVASEAVAPVDAAAPVETAPSVEAVAPAEAAPVEAPAPVESAVPVEAAASVDAAAPAETAALVQPTVPVETAAPVEVAAQVEATPATEAVAPVETAVPVEVVVPAETAASAEVAAPVEAAAPAESVAPAEAPAPAEIPAQPEVTPASEVPVTVEAVEEAAKVETPAEAVQVVEQPEQKTETPVATEAPAVPEPVPEAPKVVEPSDAPAVAPGATPEKSGEAQAPTDSPPLANTPSKEEAPAVPAAKSEERRKPAGKLKLVPPAAADPLPTPDSELEDAASLAQSIIASELRTPTVTSPEPAAPASTPPAPEPELKQTLSVEEPEVPTPPVGAVSLAQIGVKSPKGKSTTAAQIASSVVEAPSADPAAAPAAPAAAPAAPATPPADVPKKKVVKKVVKKDAGATGADAPVPPPRKKEKKPKEK